MPANSAPLQAYHPLPADSTYALVQHVPNCTSPRPANSTSLQAYHPLPADSTYALVQHVPNCTSPRPANSTSRLAHHILPAVSTSRIAHHILPSVSTSWLYHHPGQMAARPGRHSSPIPATISERLMPYPSCTGTARQPIPAPDAYHLLSGGIAVQRLSVK